MQVTLETIMTAQAATTATLTPKAGGRNGKGDMTDSVSSVVITFTNARDAKMFAELNREYEVLIRRR